MSSSTDLIPAKQATLEKSLREREAEIALLRDITELVGSEYSLQKVFDLVAERARALIQAETVTIPVLAEDQSSYTYQAADGANAEELLNANLPIDIGVCGWVFRHHKAWWRGVLKELDANERNKWEAEAGTLILVPLAGKRQFLGGIAGINKIGGGEFNQRDLELLTLFAGQVSIAIENAIFFEELNSARRESDAYRAQLEESNERLSQTNSELQRLAVHDPLTGLPNRTLITDRLQQSILNAKREQHSVALLMLDLDHFKEVNDTLGHATGDSLLIHVGKRLLKVLREPDTLGRLGGDEFAIVLPHASHDDAIIVARKIQASLQKLLVIDQNSFSVSASIGIALYPDHGEDPTSLLKSADVAMYIAKRNRDELAVYDAQHDTNNPDRLELLRDLRSAIHERQIELAFQPTLDLHTGTLVGVEALARWTHPVKGPIPPYDFVPILEQTGLIRQFTEGVLELAFESANMFQRNGFDLSMAVNISMHNLRDDALVPLIRKLLEENNFSAGKLVLEMTESAIMHDPEHSLGILTELHDMGVMLSIDDFGTGYSSLSYLKRLPVQQLKIDRSFVTNMMSDNDDAMIVRSTIDLAHNLGLSTVAEGVESEQVLKAVRMMECDIAQGYLISRPISAQALMQLLKSAVWPVNRCQTSADTDSTPQH